MNTLDKSDKPSPTDKAEIGEIELWLASLQRAKGDHQGALKVRVFLSTDLQLSMQASP